MKPLSALNYSKRNKKKSASVIACIAVSVFLLYTVQIIFGSIEICNKLVRLNAAEKYSLIYKQENNVPISSQLITEVKNNENIDRVIPLFQRNTDFANITLSLGVRVYELDKDDMNYYMKMLNIKIKEGRLPKYADCEIAIDYRLAKNKGLKRGDMIGEDASRKEILQGEYKIVGLLDGQVISAITPMDEKLDKNKIYSNGMMVFPKVGKMKELNQYLDTIRNSADIVTYDDTKKDLDMPMKNAEMTINIFAAMIIIAMVVAVGNISYVHFFERRKEFGILRALGYSMRSITLKTFYEISIMNLMGFFLGLLLAIFIGLILKLIFLSPLGVSISFWSPQGLIQALCIPIFTTLFSIKPINFMIRKVDPISIIEGVD